MYRELAEKPKPTPRSWWQRQNWACRLGLHALKKKYFAYNRWNSVKYDKFTALRWWKRSKWSAGTLLKDREYIRCVRGDCNYAIVVYRMWHPPRTHKERITHENQLPPSLRRKKLLK